MGKPTSPWGAQLRPDIARCTIVRGRLTRTHDTMHWYEHCYVSVASPSWLCSSVEDTRFWGAGKDIAAVLTYRSATRLKMNCCSRRYASLQSLPMAVEPELRDV